MPRQFTTPILLPADPVNPLEASTKQFVDTGDTSLQRTKQPSAPRWTNWRTRAVGSQVVTGTLGDDGVAFLVSPTASETATIANNRLQVNWPDSTGGALYLQQPTGGTVRRIGASFGFGPSANTTTAAIALATWDTASPVGGTTNAQIHLALTASSATFGVVVNGAVQNLVNWPYFTPLAQDWTTYHVEAAITGSTVYVMLPDGQSRSWTDSRIASIQGQTACWEFFRDANTTTAPIAFYDTWAATSSTVGGLTSRANVAREIETYRSEVSSLYVPLSLRGPRGGIISFSNLSGSFNLNFSAEAARWTLTGNVTVSPPTGTTTGSDGQVLRLEVFASGADRVVTFTGFETPPRLPKTAFTIPSGTWFTFLILNRNGTYRLLEVDSVFSPAWTVVPYSTTPSFNASSSSYFVITMTGNITGIGITGLNDGQILTIEMFASGAARTFTTTGLTNKSGKTLAYTIASGTSSYMTLNYSARSGVTLTSLT